MKISRWQLIVLCLWSAIAMGQGSGIITLDNRAPLTNQDVIAMARAKLSDAIITKAIRANRTSFDVSAPALIRLQNSGVSQTVIEAMLSMAPNKVSVPNSPPPEDAMPELTSRETPKSADPPSMTELPEDVGVYVKQHGKLVTIEPEIVNWRSGGVLKTTATLGIDKGHVNGTIPGQHSRLVVTGEPLEFYIKCQEGNSASEYQLLHLWDKGNRREFRAVTGGILHHSGGAQRNEVQFTYDKVTGRVYKIQFTGLQPGEYGFLAPGALQSSNAASLGKAYTFRVLE